MSFEDPELTAAARARALLEAADEGRGVVKRLGAWLDAHPEVRGAVIAEGRRRGADLPDEAGAWPGKKLLRRALSREEDARVPLNPTKRDEAFTCAHCDREVPPHGRTARDHCPWCLRSLHVDVVPGDRASDCGGLLDPVALDRRGADWVIRYRCRRCGHEGRNRAVLDGDVPDAWEALMALASEAR